MKQIKIKGKKYNFKYTIRALFIFESITGKSFEIKSLFDNYVFLYSILIANNPDKTMLFDDFINCLDEDPKIYQQLNEILNEHNKMQQVLEGGEKEEENEEVKKK